VSQVFPAHWDVFPFSLAVKDATSEYSKLQKSEYLEQGRFPIVDQGQQKFGGYTDDESVVSLDGCPAIVFGDHTRVFKFIDEPFCLGADGAKVLEPKAELDKKFLFYYLSSLNIESAGYSRHFKFLKENVVPVPPLPEQKRIAAILDKAYAIRRKRQQAIQLADDFLRAVFLDMFGDPVTNPKGWPKRTLKLLGKSATGRTPPSEKADMWGEGLPFVTPGDLSGRVDSSVREVTQEGAEHSKVCRTGSLLVCCIGATIGKVGIAGCPVAFNQQINAQEWGADILDVYGYFVFKLFPDLVRERAIQTTLPILKKSLFDEIEIPVPLIGLQEKFSAIAQKVSESSLRHESGLNTPLFESLSQLAFSGQL